MHISGVFSTPLRVYLWCRQKAVHDFSALCFEGFSASTMCIKIYNAHQARLSSIICFLIFPLVFGLLQKISSMDNKNV